MNNLMSHGLALLITCMFMMISIKSEAQKTIATASGQVISYTSVDSWSMVIDTLDNNISDPLYSSAISQLKSLEALGVVKNEDLKLKIIDANVSLSHAKVLKKKEDENSLKGQIKNFQKEISQVYNEHTNISKDIIELRKKYNQDPSTKLLSKLIEKYGLTSDTPPIDVPQKEEEKIVVQDVPKASEIHNEEMPAAKAELSKWDLVVEAANYKPAISKNDNCQIAYNGKNAETKKRQIQIKMDQLLGFTPKRLENYYKAEEYLKCSAGLTKYDNDYFVVIQLRFNSRDIKKSYGNINQGDFMRLHLITGADVFLTAVEDGIPQVESYTGNTVYNARFMFKNKQDYKDVASHYLDTMGIMWSSGFEEYPVYKVDFLMNQIECLKDVE